jgi:hypothetical protein
VQVAIDDDDPEIIYRLEKWIEENKNIEEIGRFVESYKYSFKNGRMRIELARSGVYARSYPI